MLNPKKYKEFNEVIANFMNLQKEDEKWISPINGSKIVNLKYHESWDWIMPVIEKLRNYETPHFYIEFRIDYTNSEVLTTGENCDILVYEYIPEEPTWFLSLYAKCYKLIKWINENN